jgi:hypothetical protein
MREFTVLLFLVTGLSVCLSADQDPPTPSPPVAIMKHSWHLDSGWLRDSSAQASNAEGAIPALTVPGSTLNGVQPGMRRAIPRPTNIEPSEQPKTRDVFRYEVTVQNNSGKSIRRIFWAYTFLNPENSFVLARHWFATETKIKPGKSKNLEGLTYNPPSTVSSVSMLKKAPGWEKSEKVEILRIQFEDGTFWFRRPSAQPIQ